MTEREATCEILRPISPLLKSATIVELGAHHGTDTAVLYDACTAGLCNYVAVEADPRNIPLLAKSVFGRRVSIIWAAACQFSGETALHLCHGADTSSSIRQPAKHLDFFPGITFPETIKVPAVTLNELAHAYSLGIIDLLWCDVQGAEKDVILGGQVTLAKTRYALMECDREEMYAGQATPEELLYLIGHQWEVIQEWPENANMLLRNRELT